MNVDVNDKTKMSIVDLMIKYYTCLTERGRRIYGARKALWRSLVASLAVMIAVGLPESALADCPPGLASGNWMMSVGPAGTYGYANWDATNVIGPQEFLTFRAYGSGLAGSNCVTTWFDWGLTPNHHYDARAVRDCSASTAWDAYEGPTDTYSAIKGMQKLAVCHGVNDTLGACSEHPQRMCSVAGVSPVFNTANFTTRWARRNSNGTYNSFNGGIPDDPNQ